MMKTLTKILFTIAVLLSTPKTTSTMEANIKHTAPASVSSVNASSNTPLVKADNIPNENTAFKTWMPYTAITNTASLQYKLQENAQTDEHGLRIYDDQYMVAVGTPYGDVGDKITVTLDTGRQLHCIVGDSKGDRHYHAIYNTNHEFVSANVLEFIVDRNTLDQDAKESGDISSIENFEGEVVSIERI